MTVLHRNASRHPGEKIHDQPGKTVRLRGKTRVQRRTADGCSRGPIRNNPVRRIRKRVRPSDMVEAIHHHSRQRVRR
jgi:hypothetical protein